MFMFLIIMYGDELHFELFLYSDSYLHDLVKALPGEGHFIWAHYTLFTKANSYYRKLIS